MASVGRELVFAAINRAHVLIDYDIYNTIEKRHEFMQQTILANEYLTEDEKSDAKRILNESHDRDKIRYNVGKKRICENCQLECLATLYCERCIRNYLKTNFESWTSGNVNIDNLIRNCQLETIAPYSIIEWIPYNNLQDIIYITEGGFSEIYTAKWINGCYKKWDSKEQQLRRYSSRNVILKMLGNVKNANRSWFDEAKSHLTISNKWTSIVKCFGLTQHPNGNYMLVMHQFDTNLGNYLQQNHNQLTWKKRIKIAYDIIKALYRIYKENAIHRDLHPGNILYLQYNDYWHISDFGFCGPADRPLGCIYGNLPYIAPEVITGKGYTHASDIYSFGILMWEIATGRQPFSDYDDYDLAINIIDGIRPKTISGIPLEYKNLMEQCWDADPTKRPDINTLRKKMLIMRNSYYQNDDNDQPMDNSAYMNNLQSNANSSSISSNSNSTSSLISKYRTSKIHEFKGFPEPRYATKEEQEAYYKQLDFDIPDEENYKENNKLKRSFSNNSDEDEEEDSVNKPKKIKLEGYLSKEFGFDI